LRGAEAWIAAAAAAARARLPMVPTADEREQVDAIRSLCDRIVVECLPMGHIGRARHMLGVVEGWLLRARLIDRLDIHIGRE
jgi:hypothetical protein